MRTSSALFPAFIVFMTICCGQYLMAQSDTEPRLYETTARMQISVNPEYMPPDSLANEYRRLKALRNHHLTCRKAIERVVKDLNIDQGKDFPRIEDGTFSSVGRKNHDALVERIQKQVTIVAEVDTNEVQLIAIRVRYSDEKMAREIADKLSENYRRDLRMSLDDSLLSLKNQYGKEVERYQKKSFELEGALRRFSLSLPPLYRVVDEGFPAVSQVERDLKMLKEGTALATARQRLARLREAGKDKATGDLYVIELARLQSEVDAAEAVSKENESIEMEERVEAFLRNHAAEKKIWRRITEEQAEARAELNYWETRWRTCSLALAHAVSGRTYHITVFEFAPTGKPVVQP